MARSTRAEWAKRVERWRDSGLTAKEFAAEQDISANSLTFWKWKLRQSRNPDARSTRSVMPKREKAQRADKPAFLRLVTTPQVAASMGSIDVMLANGIVVRVPNDFDESSLLRLVCALGGS